MSKLRSVPRNVQEAEAQWRREQAQQPVANLNPASVYERRKAEAAQAQSGARQPSATEADKATVGSLEYANAIYAKRAQEAAS